MFANKKRSVIKGRVWCKFGPPKNRDIATLSRSAELVQAFVTPPHGCCRNSGRPETPPIVPDSARAPFAPTGHAQAARSKYAGQWQAKTAGCMDPLLWQMQWRMTPPLKRPSWRNRPVAATLKRKGLAGVHGDPVVCYFRQPRPGQSPRIPCRTIGLWQRQ